MYRMRSIRRYRDRYGDLWIEGRAYLGPKRIPSMPVRIALTDRVTGAVKVLSHSGSPGSLAISFVDIDPSWKDVAIYPVNGEPWVLDPNGVAHRLFLASGVLNVGTTATPGNSALVLTRNGFDTHVLNITATTNNIVVYTEYDL